MIIALHMLAVAMKAVLAHGHGVQWSDGFLGIGGSASKTDRSQQLAGYGDLGNIFNTGLNNSNADTNAGQNDLGTAAGFNSKILNGNRSSIMSALSPQIASITGQANQAKKQQASLGTARGGGTNAGNQQQQQQVQGAISSVVGGAQPQAAKDMASIGSTETNAGQQALGTAGGAAQNLTGDAADSYQTTSAQNSASGAAAAQLAAGLIFGF
jgi:hypothetical protein